MNSDIVIFIDGQRLTVPAETSVAAALAQSGDITSRRSVLGEPRAPFCGIGICQECRVSVNGRRVLACQTPCQPEMRIERSDYEHTAV